MTYTEELLFIKDTVKKTYEEFGGKKPDSIQQKSEFDLVTEIDYAIETELIKAINSRFPSDNFLSEEFNSSNTLTGRTWIIDPIDGTCNFSNGMPSFGVQCALSVDGNVVLSYLYLPIFNEEFYAILNEGAYLNGNKIEIPADRTINHSTVSIGDFSHNNTDMAMLQYNALAKLFPKVAKIRMFGAACIDFCYAACGRTDGCVILTKNIWDIAPGILLCKESGCIVTNINGNHHQFNDDGVIVASTPELHATLIESLNNSNQQLN